MICLLHPHVTGRGAEGHDVVQWYDGAEGDPNSEALQRKTEPVLRFLGAVGRGAISLRY